MDDDKTKELIEEIKGLRKDINTFGLAIFCAIQDKGPLSSGVKEDIEGFKEYLSVKPFKDF